MAPRYDYTVNMSTTQLVEVLEKDRRTDDVVYSVLCAYIYVYTRRARPELHLNSELKVYTPCVEHSLHVAGPL